MDFNSKPHPPPRMLVIQGLDPRLPVDRGQETSELQVATGVTAASSFGFPVSLVGGILSLLPEVLHLSRGFVLWSFPTQPWLFFTVPPHTLEPGLQGPTHVLAHSPRCKFCKVLH